MRQRALPFGVLPLLLAGCAADAPPEKDPSEPATPAATTAGAAPEGAAPAGRNAAGRDPAGAVAITVGESHTCALLRGGTAYCWGGNAAGQLGAGTESEAETSPVRVAGDVGFTAISAGDAHTCALDAEGRAWCWGANDSGQLGTGATGEEPVRAPVRVAGGARFTALAAGRGYTCALDARGRAWCWGWNHLGQLGNGALEDAARPAPVTGDMYFAAITAGGGHTCALDAGGRAWCWGAGGNGELGGGSAARGIPRPTRVAGDLAFADVHAGTGLTCAVATDGAGWCWGRNDFGQLGGGGSAAPGAAHAEPRRVAGDVAFSIVRAGAMHVCGLDRQGAAWCWGRGEFGQLGGAPADERCAVQMTPGAPCATRPDRVRGGLVFRDLAAGIYHTCALTAGGEVYCWGANGYGGVGNGGYEPAHAPVRVRFP